MLQRDKENRELRKLNKERMKEHHKYLVNKGKNINLSNISIETIEEIRKNRHCPKFCVNGNRIQL